MLAVPKVMPAAIKPPVSRDDISTEHAVDLVILTNIVEIRDQSQSPATPLVWKCFRDVSWGRDCGRCITITDHDPGDDKHNDVHGTCLQDDEYDGDSCRPEQGRSSTKLVGYRRIGETCDHAAYVDS